MQIQRGSWDDWDQTHGVRWDRWTKWFHNSSKLRWIFQGKKHKCEPLLANYERKSLGGCFFYLWMDGTMATNTDGMIKYVYKMGLH